MVKGIVELLTLHVEDLEEIANYLVDLGEYSKADIVYECAQRLMALLG
jgi:hypothetical protein